jgi:hypothetical protein
MVGPTPRSQHIARTPWAKAKAAARRSGRVPREHLPNDSPLLHGLGGRRPFSLGPFVVDGGAPAVALARAAGAVLDSLPARVLLAIAHGDATVLYEHGASAGDYDYNAPAEVGRPRIGGCKKGCRALRMPIVSIAPCPAGRQA